MEGMLMLLVMMIITMILTWALNGEQRKRAVSLLLCAAMMSSYIPAINVARADSIAKPVLVNEQVLVNGTKATQIGAVTYSASGSAYTLDTSSARVRVKNGDSISFDGAISAPEGETISWVRVDIYDANTEEPYTVGAEYYRASGMKVQEFDLSSIPALTIGEAFGSKDYILTEGGKYIVMFCVGDSNGNTFADMDADIEEDQGPAILVDVKLSPSNCDHPHSDYRYVRHSSGEIRKHSYGDSLTHQVEPLYERYCGLCDVFLMNIWGQGAPEEHTFDENGVCLACGYTDITGVNMFALSRATNPTITTLTPENVDLTSATLCGKLVDEGGYDVDWYYFAYREEGGTWAFTEIQMEDLANGDIVEQELEGLEQGTTYEYQFQVGNSQLGQVVAYGDTKEFTTDVESVQLDTPVLDEMDYEVYVGETLTISWDPVDNATEYTIYIYDNNDVCETIEDCSYEYEFDQEGVYSIAVYATCSDNRDVYMQSEAGTANVTVTECDHNYLEDVTEDEWGYDRNDYEEHWHYQEITYTCEDCGHSYDDEIEDYFEHEWDAATSECDVCGCVLPELTIENFTVEEEYQLGDTFEFSGKIKGNGSDIARVSINVKRPGGASITHLDSTKVENTEYDLKLVDDIELDKPGEYQIFIWATDVAGNGLNSADAVPGDGTFVYSFDVVYDISVDTIDTSDEATMNTVLMKGRLNISGDQNAITGFEHWGPDGEKIETLLSASCYDGDVFEWTLTDLKPDTEYSFRAVAKDYMRPIGNGDYERVYGEVVTVRTKAESEYCPQVETLSASDIDEYSAVIHAELLYTADVETEYGFIIGGANSTVTSTVIVGTDTDVTEYSYEWTGLEPDYKYSYQAYAKNEYGTVYGEEYGFTTDEVIQIQLDSPVLNTEENGSYSVDVGESLTISWDPVENATEYSVFIWQDGQEITRSIEQRTCSYEYTFDTAGTYVVGVYAMNSAKAYKYLQSETGANIYVSDVAEDTEAPMIENIVSNPESPIVAGTTVTFTTRVFDDMGLAKAEWYIGEDCKYTEDLEGLVQTISFETSELTVGENKITVTAVDAVGWRTSHSLTVTVTEAEELVNASVDFEVAEDTVVIGESVTLDGAASSGDYYLKKIQVAVFTDEAKGHGYLSSAVKEFKYEDAVTEFDLSTIGNVEIKKTFNCTGHPELETQPQEDFPAGESWVGVYVSVYGVDGDEASNLFGASAFAPVKTTKKAETVTLEAEPSGEIAANTTVRFTAQSNSDEVTLCIKTLNDVENEWYTIEKPMKKSETEEGVFTAENQFLDGGTKYIWAQTADGTKSNEVEITVIAAAVKLSVPKYTGVEAAVVEEKAVLSWETVENADRYTAYLSLGTAENNRIELTNLINNEQINYTFTEAGTYCLMIYACGAEGSQYGTSDPCVVNIVVSEKEATVDKKSPEINQITSTVSSPITAGTEVTFSTAASDDVKLAKIELFIDGELKKTEAVSGLSGTISYTTSALAVGEHTVMVVATDASGLTNDVFLTVTVQKADSSTCAHLNTTVIPDPQYVSINAEQHKLVYTYWTHCLDCDTGLSNVQDEDLPEKHTWKDGACEKCKHVCSHNYVADENKPVQNSGIWKKVDSEYHIRDQVKYWETCTYCGGEKEGELKQDASAIKEKHNMTNVDIVAYNYNSKTHQALYNVTCSANGCGHKLTSQLGEHEAHQIKNGKCQVCDYMEPIVDNEDNNEDNEYVNSGIYSKPEVEEETIPDYIIDTSEIISDYKESINNIDPSFKDDYQLAKQVLNEEYNTDPTLDALVALTDPFELYLVLTGSDWVERQMLEDMLCQIIGNINSKGYAWESTIEEANGYLDVVKDWKNKLGIVEDFMDENVIYTLVTEESVEDITLIPVPYAFEKIVGEASGLLGDIKDISEDVMDFALFHLKAELAHFEVLEQSLKGTNDELLESVITEMKFRYTNKFLGGVWQAAKDGMETVGSETLDKLLDFVGGKMGGIYSMAYEEVLKASGIVDTVEGSRELIISDMYCTMINGEFRQMIREYQTNPDSLTIEDINRLSAIYDLLNSALIVRNESAKKLVDKNAVWTDTPVVKQLDAEIAQLESMSLLNWKQNEYYDEHFFDEPELNTGNYYLDALVKTQYDTGNYGYTSCWDSISTEEKAAVRGELDKLGEYSEGCGDAGYTLKVLTSRTGYAHLILVNEEGMGLLVTNQQTEYHHRATNETIVTTLSKREVDNLEKYGAELRVEGVTFTGKVVSGNQKRGEFRTSSIDITTEDFNEIMGNLIHNYAGEVKGKESKELSQDLIIDLLYEKYEHNLRAADRIGNSKYEQLLIALRNEKQNQIEGY